jgi:hypothetical protein
MLKAQAHMDLDKYIFLALPFENKPSQKIIKKGNKKKLPYKIK